ncbi:MAG: MEMO1 family protein [Candidatus Dojkabacteria bacterium]
MAQLNRPSTASGVFYPLDFAELVTKIDELFSQVLPRPLEGKIRAIVAPHSPYQFAGPVYAAAYKPLLNQQIDECFVLAPSHYSRFEGIVSANFKTWDTPIGVIEQSHRTARIISSDDALAKELLKFDEAKFETEHSVEVQLPFIQKVFGAEAKFIPMLFGTGSPRQYAKALNAHLDPNDLIIASAELSHGYPEQYAKEIDDQSVKAILGLEIDKVESDKFKSSSNEIFATLIELARINSWKAHLLMLNNSSEYDNQTESTVGYLALAFTE